MKYSCSRCGGRGWLKPERVNAWPEPCGCTAGKITKPQLARMLKVRTLDIAIVERSIVAPKQRRTVKRRAEVAERVFTALARVFPGELGIKGIRQRVANL